MNWRSHKISLCDIHPKQKISRRLSVIEILNKEDDDVDDRSEAFVVRYVPVELRLHDDVSEVERLKPRRFERRRNDARRLFPCDRSFLSWCSSTVITAVSKTFLTFFLKEMLVRVQKNYEIYILWVFWGQRSGSLKVIANNKLTCVHAEHSIYFFAPIFRASSSPSSVFIGFDFWLPCDHFIGWTLRSSDWRPTRMMGTFGANSLNSGTHFSLTFWNEIWSTRLKQRRNIFVCG